MPIPDNIKREHVFQAIITIDREGIPLKRKSIYYNLLYAAKEYPCKLIISWASIFIDDEELDPDPNNFTTYHVQDYLEKLGFTVF
ncbi:MULTISPECIES: hypothetical protein [Chryseobacterium]|uniref:hypothetical protein n=1 Tax=Chryseobacterium TaxID=59732 RepID=UPI001295A53A|nr:MULTISPECIES: hypothetical protein [Chryseobacterium]MDR6923719.1 hypothetical protein [Chryseobacterium sp. 2987]